MLLAALLVTVRMLALPLHATIEPLGSRALMAVSRTGVVAATVTVAGFRTRPVVWTPGGVNRVIGITGSIAGFDRDGALFINSDRPCVLADRVRGR